MKILLVALLTLSSTFVSAKEMAIILSPHHPTEASNAQLNQVVSILTKVELGTNLHVINGSNANVITTFSIPYKSYYRHAKVRIKANKAALAKLKAFTDSYAQNGRILGAADIPNTLFEVGQHHNQVNDIVLLGISPFYDTYEALDMTSNRVPSDGFILSKRTASPFGTKGLKILQDKRIHWVISKPITNSLLQELVSRFWQVYIDQLHGKTVSFTHNIDAVTNRLFNNASPLNNSYQLDTSGKREMQAVRDITAQKTIIYTEAITQQTPPKLSAKTVKYPLTLGIEWSGKADIDIYAVPHDGAEALYFGNTSSPKGRFYKDIRSGGKTDKRYETIELNSVDVKRLHIGLNVYAAPTSVDKITGTLRLKLGGKVYARAFAFTDVNGSTKGNRGKDINAVLASGHDTAFSKYLTVSDILSLQAGAVL